MKDKRQKIQLTLPFDGSSRGETPKRLRKGPEPGMAKSETQSPTSTLRLMEEVIDEQNMKRAMDKVMGNKGAPGVDGMTVRELPRYLRRHGARLRQQLLDGSYEPKPVRRVEIPKDGSGVRMLGIPTVVDRLVMQALLQVLQPLWDPTFSEHSYGFRPRRSAHQAVAQAQSYLEQGCKWVVDIDVEKFFDRVCQDRLMSKVAERVEDKRVLKLIWAFLNAGVLVNGLVEATREGVPQGGPLSPLLSNLVLDELDKELEKRGLAFVRFADDCNIYVRSQRAGKRVMQSISRFITRRLRLKVNETKSAVDRPHRRKFLGFSFTPGSKPRRKIAPKSIQKLKGRIRGMTRRRRGISLQQLIEELSSYLRGWKGYFGFAQTPAVLKRLDGWIRRRIRSFVWKQWKNGRRRFKQLRKRGVRYQEARDTAGSSKGPWRLSRTRALQIALNNAYFHELGLFSLYLNQEA